MAQIKTCNPCERKEMVSECTHWCRDCEEGLCSKCLMDHKVIKLTKYHHVVEISNTTSVESYQLLSIPFCKKHPHLREDVLCKDHDVICCHSCLTEHHKSCKLVSNLDIAARGVRNSELYKTVHRNMEKIKDTTQKILYERQSAAEDLRTQQQRIKKKIANLKSKFIEHLNNLEKNLLHELSTIGQENQEDTKLEKTEVKNIEEEVEKCQSTLTFVTEHASESQLFSLLKKQEKVHDEMLNKLKSLPPKSRVKITLEEASHEIKSVKSLGYLSVHYEKVNQPENLTLCHRSDDGREIHTADNMCSMLTMENEFKISPEDFITKDVKYDRINYFYVQGIVETEDNHLIVAGSTQLYISTGYGGYTYCYKVNKYNQDMSYIDSVSFDQKPLDLTCIPRTNKLVVLCEYKGLYLINTVSMENIWCILLRMSHGGRSLAVNKTAIFVQTSHYNGTCKDDACLLVYNLTGCLVKIIDFPFFCRSVNANTDDSFTCLSANDDAVYKLRPDGSEIFSYSPKGLTMITVDQNDHIYMLIGDSIKILNPKTFETQTVFKYKSTGMTTSHITFNSDFRKLYILRQNEHPEDSEKIDDYFIMTLRRVTSY